MCVGFSNLQSLIRLSDSSTSMVIQLLSCESVIGLVNLENSGVVYNDNSLNSTLRSNAKHTVLLLK